MNDISATCEEEEEHLSLAELDIRTRILTVLKIYPRVSPSMLQIGIGPWVKPALWRPVLEHMKTSGEVIQTHQTYETPTGRYRTATILSLPTASQ